jgi:hypothetical protein
MFERARIQSSNPSDPREIRPKEEDERAELRRRREER